MNKKILFSLLIFFALAQTYQNCGGARQFATLESQSNELAALLPPTEEFSELQSEEGTVLAESTLPVATPSTTSSSATATVKNTPSGTGSQVPAPYKYIIDYHLPFGAISESMKAPLQAGVGQFVRNSSCTNVPSTQYECGEIPFGTILDRHRKLVTTMDLGKSFQGKNGKQSYNFASTDGKDIHLKIYMNRQQRPGTQVLLYLPTQRTAALNMSDKLGEHILFALTPRGGLVDTQVCTMIPGLEVDVDSIQLKGEARKSDALPFGIDAVAKGTVTIDPGQLTFDQAFACATLRLTFTNGVPQLSLKDFSGIKFQKVSHKGLQVKKNIKVSGVLGFFDNLFNLGVEDRFKDAIHKEVTKKVNKEVAISANDVKNGSYLSKYIDKGKLEPLVEQANKHLQKSFRESGYITELSERVTQAACATAFASLGLSTQAQVELTRLCISPQIQVKGLYASPQSHADCYRAYFDPRGGQSLGGSDWWKTSCQMIIRTEVVMQKGILPLVGCLTDSIKTMAQIEQKCQSVIATLVQQHSNGELKEIIRTLSTASLSEQKITEIRNLVTHQFGSTISLGMLKKIFQ